MRISRRSVLSAVCMTHGITSGGEEEDGEGEEREE